jgi:ribosomal protein L11 methyltransferase
MSAKFMHVWSKLASARWRDAWEDRVLGLGQTNAVIRALPGGKTIRIEVYCASKADALQRQKDFGGSVRRLASKNWAKHVTARRSRPIKIRDRLLVTGEGDPAKLARVRKEYADREVISIPAEMAFGTGEHETTSTCLRFLVDASRELGQGGRSWDLLDLGTGTGILAISASKLGARRVEACDYDPHAIRVAGGNVDRHEVRDGVQLRQHDVLAWEPTSMERYDCVTANLFSDVLMASFGKIAEVTLPGGIVIASGILAEQSEACLRAAREAGLEIEEVKRKGKWVTFRARKGA